MKKPRDRPMAHRKTGSKKPKKRTRRQGHPSNTDPRLLAMREREDREVRQIVRLVKREATASPEEKALVGPLAAAAKRAAEIICARAADLADDEHLHGVANYLTEQLGAVVDGFDPDEYRAWRERCIEAVA